MKEDNFYNSDSALPEDIQDWRRRSSYDKNYLKIAFEEDGLDGLEFALQQMQVAGKTTDDKLRNAGYELQLVPLAA